MEAPQAGRLRVLGVHGSPTKRRSKRKNRHGNDFEEACTGMSFVADCGFPKVVVLKVDTDCIFLPDRPLWAGTATNLRLIR